MAPQNELPPELSESSSRPRSATRRFFSKAATFLRAVFRYSFRKRAPSPELKEATARTFVETAKAELRSKRFDDARTAIRIAIFWADSAETRDLATRIDRERQIAVAVSELRERARRGDAGARILLGVRLFRGRDVEKDESEAFRLFLEAADQDRPAAAYYAGRCFESGVGTSKNLDEALRRYGEAARRGVEKAARRSKRLIDAAPTPEERERRLRTSATAGDPDLPLETPNKDFDDADLSLETENAADLSLETGDGEEKKEKKRKAEAPSPKKRRQVEREPEEEFRRNEAPSPALERLYRFWFDDDADNWEPAITLKEVCDLESKVIWESVGIREETVFRLYGDFYNDVDLYDDV